MKLRWAIYENEVTPGMVSDYRFHYGTSIKEAKKVLTDRVERLEYLFGEVWVTVPTVHITRESL